MCAGSMMTGLGPSLRRLPSADARAAGTSASASQPEGTSDAGDSADSTVAGMLSAHSQTHPLACLPNC